MNKETKKIIELLNAARKNLLDAMNADVSNSAKADAIKDEVLTVEQFMKIVNVDDVLADIVKDLVERGRK